tara:strand:+ start:518 stop:1297 length:780 start_codon:yes stop_codon:yes gene_type:complete
MDIFNSILLGVIQGLTEFLPISSSGHLVIGNYLLDIQNNDILFEVTVHLGTLFAIIYYYRLELVKILKECLTGDRQAINYIVLILIATLPAVLVGLLFNSEVKSFYNINSVSYCLLITGVIIFSSKFSNQKSINLNYMNAIIIGVGQAFAILPGISRSGITITIALLLGLNRSEASKFSFFMAIPIIVGAVMLEIINVEKVNQIHFTNLILGALSATIIGYFSISWLIKLINKLHFWKFSFYTWSLGCVMLILNYYGRS